MKPVIKRLLTTVIGVAAMSLLPVTMVVADETCNSPYMTRIIKGQEHYLHVWTLGVKGMGDGSDKLVTVDV
jgi:methanethiol oxidase